MLRTETKLTRWLQDVHGTVQSDTATTDLNIESTTLLSLEVSFKPSTLQYPPYTAGKIISNQLHRRLRGSVLKGRKIVHIEQGLSLHRPQPPRHTPHRQQPSTNPSTTDHRGRNSLSVKAMPMVFRFPAIFTLPAVVVARAAHPPGRESRHSVDSIQ